MGFDSNFLIYHLNRTEPYASVVTELLAAVRDGFKEGYVSVVSELEMLVQPVREARWWEIEQIGTVLDAPQMHVVELTRAIARTAAQIRADRRLSLADATIVATAVHAGCDVLVGNDERCAQRVREIPYVFLSALIGEQR